MKRINDPKCSDGTVSPWAVANHKAHRHTEAACRIPCSNFVDASTAVSAYLLHMKTLELLPPPEMMYRALVKRDPSFEGIFFVGVRTTGIFCRPTCSAKKPARKIVDFFATSSDALENGYRPCLRCHPLDPNARPPKLIERSARRSGARAGRTPHGQGTGGALDRSFNRAAAVQTPLRNDVSSLSSCAAGWALP